MASEHHNTSQHSRFQENINLPTWQYAAVCRHTRPEHTNNPLNFIGSLDYSFISDKAYLLEDFTIKEEAPTWF